MSANSFTFLGTSSGIPQAKRANAGYLLSNDNSLSLIDCGGGVTSSFLRCGFDPLGIDRVFISHTHPDHCCELPLVIQMVYLAGRTEPLDIFLPDEFVQPFKSFLPALYLFPEKLPFSINISGYTEGRVYSDNFLLDAIANSHLKGNADVIKMSGYPNKMQSFSLIIDTGKKKLLFSGDIGSLEDLQVYMTGLDYVVIESTHIDFNEFLVFASLNDIDKFIITHLGTDEEIEQLQQAVNSSGIKNITFAETGMKLSL
jgi:ribonuclease BN (tRNA processing enzyme)